MQLRGQVQPTAGLEWDREEQRNGTSSPETGAISDMIS